MANPKLTKLKEMIFSNIPLKIIAVIIAIVAWIVIVNVSDPSQRVTVSGISVNILNENALIDKGYIYQIESGSVISIVVKGPQTIVENLRSTDFYAYADLSERTPESDTAKIYVSCINEDIIDMIDIVSQKSEYIQLAIDNKVDKDLPINVVITGTPASGYVVGNYGSSPTTIKISGAEATVKRIVSAEITYDVESMTTDIVDSVKPVFYDKDGKVVKSDKLELSRSDVQIHIEILPTKWVKVNYVVTGNPADGYAMTGYSSNVTSVNIAGKKSDLNNISSIDIPSGVVDITDAISNRTFEINMATYLPQGYTIVSSSSKMKVSVEVKKVSDVIINIPVEDISITGMGYDYLYEITTGTEANVLEVGVKGLEEIVNSLSVNDLDPKIHLLGKKPGVYTVKVFMQTGDNYSIASTYYVKVTITHKKSEENPTETESTEEDTQETQTETPSEIETETESETETEESGEI